MRMRRKKHGAQRLQCCAEFLTDRPQFDTERPVFLEIGAGKGGFAVGMCRKFPDAQYFAMERVADCVVLAAERAKAQNEADGSCGALRFIIDTADNLPELFPKGCVDRIFLNFSDPWSKKGYAKRRLTHRRYLAIYMDLLKDGGLIRFKTDNVGLFDFSLEELEAVGLEPHIVTGDLHSSEWAEDNVVTEYEANFSSQGMKINMLEVRKPHGFSVALTEKPKAVATE